MAGTVDAYELDRVARAAVARRELRHVLEGTELVGGGMDGEHRRRPGPHLGVRGKVGRVAHHTRRLAEVSVGAPAERIGARAAHDDGGGTRTFRSRAAR